MIKKIIFLPLLFLSLVISHWSLVNPVLAQEKQDFASSYDITYDIADTGITTVTEKITLRNLTSQFYATEFNSSIGATNITDVVASDTPGQKLETKIEQKDNATSINVKFNQQVVGIGKQFTWTLQYQSKDFAQKVGKVWEITIPRVSSKARLDNYQVTLSIPLTFGEPTLMSPFPKNQTTNNGKMYLTFDKDQLESTGISATFGNAQIYDFDLSYNLENKGLVPILTTIALPPDTNYQDVIYQRIEPKPINVTVDEDGNYLAWYRLNRNQDFTVKVLGSAKLYTKSKVKNPYLSLEKRKAYTAPAKYWEVDNLVIKEKLAEILKDHQNATNNEKAKIIYKYVVNFLKYDPSRIKDNIQRYGALAALNNPTQAVCMEFTDLFITFARAAGIPARELDGYAYTVNPSLRPLSLNGDTLHTWPEYWDDVKGWVMVDPTWENTTQGVDYFNKLDLDHFVFVIKGTSPEKPVPAGSYKFTNKDSTDVNVTLSAVDFLGKPQLDTQIITSDEIIAGFPGKLKVKIANNGNGTQQAASFSVLANDINILNNIDHVLGAIPPYGFVEYSFDIRTNSFFDSFKDTIVVLIGNQEFSKDVSVMPFFVFKVFPFAFALLVGGMIGVYLTILGVMVYRRRVSKSLAVSRQSSDKKKSDR